MQIMEKNGGLIFPFAASADAIGGRRVWQKPATLAARHDDFIVCRYAWHCLARGPTKKRFASH